jgi:surfeit locus 1 family protein
MPSRTPGTLRLLLRPAMFVLHVPAAVAVVAAILMGQWQLGAWQEHRESRSAELAEVDPRPLAEVMGPDDPYPGDAVGRPVTTSGRWLSGSTVYVADKEHAGTPGFWMVTPLETCGTATVDCADPAALPVVVGWIPSVETTPAAPSGAVDAAGWLQPGEGAGAADADPTDDVLPTLRVAELLQRLDRDLYGGYLILDQPAEARGGLEAVTPASLPPVPTFTALRNLLYGIEWWLFAGFAAFLWWRWSRDELQNLRARNAVADGDVSPVSEPAEGDREPTSARIPSGP